MTVQDYAKRGIALETLPLNILSGLDIMTVEEEKQVQNIINSKRRFIPTNQPINYASDHTDFKTVEQEQEFQKIIDQRKARALATAGTNGITEQNNPEANTDESEGGLELPKESEQPTEPEKPELPEEELSAKESTLKTKIKKLKKEKKLII